MADESNDLAGEYAALFEQHLRDIWSSTDAAGRMRALEAVYAKDAVVFDPSSEVHGLEAISHMVGELLAGLPAGFVFTATAPALGHHGMYSLPWRGGPPENPSMLTGYDLVRFENGLMKDIYVLINA